MISFLGKLPAEPGTLQARVLTNYWEDTEQEAFSMHSSLALLFHLDHIVCCDIIVYYYYDLKSLDPENSFDTYHWVAPHT